MAKQADVEILVAYYARPQATFHTYSLCSKGLFLRDCVYVLPKIRVFSISVTATD